MVDSRAIIKRDLYCEHCEEGIYTCDGCEDYFKVGNDLCCHKDGHFHNSCIPENMDNPRVKR